MPSYPVPQQSAAGIGIDWSNQGLLPYNSVLPMPGGIPQQPTLFGNEVCVCVCVTFLLFIGGSSGNECFFFVFVCTVCVLKKAFRNSNEKNMGGSQMQQNGFFF